MPDAPTTTSATQPIDAELHRTVVRVVTGGVGEILDRVRSLAMELETADADPDSVGTLALSTNHTAMVLVGWVSEWPEQVANARSSFENSPVSRLVGVVYNTGAAVAEATGMAEFVSSVTEPTRVALAEEIDRLANVGTAEYARGRVLAVHAFERSFDGVVGYMGDSEEVSELVREQTLGITGTAVQEMRETGAAADGLSEGVFRKLFGRSVRTVPPLSGSE
jgi:hypothetical protein